MGDQERIINGYVVVRRENGTWEYKHRLIASEKVGRDLKPNERVYFKDRNRQNFDPDNLEIRWQVPKVYKRRSHLIKRIRETKAKLRDLERQLEDLSEYPGEYNNDL